LFTIEGPSPRPCRSGRPRVSRFSRSQTRSPSLHPARGW